MYLIKLHLCILFLGIITGLYSFESEFIPYQGILKEIETDHFVIMFADKHELIAKKTALYCEDIHDKLSDKLKWHPRQKTTVVLTDHTDSPNGSANPFIRNVIHLYLTPTESSHQLQYSSDGYYNLILHEYAHIMHLDQVRGAALFWQILFGKLYQPVSGSFTWYIEGFATEVESSDGMGGRVNSSYNNAMVNRAAIDKKIPSFDELVYPIKKWPNESGAYHFGARFLRYLKISYGDEKYNKIYEDISDDFWPFIMKFVLNFKKIYGKSLKQLWNEWREYEYANIYRLTENYDLSNTKSSLIFKSNGVISALHSDNNNTIFIATNGEKKENYLYRLSNSKTIRGPRGYIGSISSGIKEDAVIYTKDVSYPGGFYYSDLFEYNFKTKIEKQITIKKRVLKISASKTTNDLFYIKGGIYENDRTTALFRAKIKNGKLSDEVEIKLHNDIDFIGNISLSDNNELLAISVKTQSGNFAIYILNLSDNNGYFVKADNENSEYSEYIEGFNAIFDVNNNLLFVGKKGAADGLYFFDIVSNKTYLIYESQGTVIIPCHLEDGIVISDYTINGESLYRLNGFDRDIHVESIPEKYDYIKPQLKNIDKLNDKLEVRPANFMRYILPGVWSIVPKVLNTDFYISDGSSYFNFPIIGPALYTENSLPFGRFYYDILIGWDYMKNYPENSFNFRINLPALTIGYSWSNWAGGSKMIVNDKIYGQPINNRFPICFSNSLDISSELPIASYGVMFGRASITHYFYEYDDKFKNGVVNKLYFIQTLGFYYINRSNYSNRWDSGFLFSLTGLQLPPIFTDYSLFILAANFLGRLPIGRGFFFTNIKAAAELTGNSILSAGTNMLNIQGLGGQFGSESETLFNIDTKAFVTELGKISTGNAFAGVDMGIEINIYNKTKYIHFGTLVFNEVYFRTFSEFVYIYNSKINALYGILFDQALEFTISMFAAYGNLKADFTLGGAIGYRIGDTQPAWGLYGILSFGF